MKMLKKSALLPIAALSVPALFAAGFCVKHRGTVKRIAAAAEKLINLSGVSDIRGLLGNTASEQIKDKLLPAVSALAPSGTGKPVHKVMLRRFFRHPAEGMPKKVYIKLVF